MAENQSAERWYPATNPWVWAQRLGLWTRDDVAATALVLALVDEIGDAPTWPHRQGVGLLRAALNAASPDAARLLDALLAPPGTLPQVLDDAPVHIRTAVAARTDLPDDLAAVLAVDRAAPVLCALVINPAAAEDLAHGVVWTQPDDAVQRAYERRFPRQRPDSRRGPRPPSLTTRQPAGAAGASDPAHRGRLSVEQTRDAFEQSGWRPRVPPEDVTEDHVADVLRRTDDRDLLRHTFEQAHDYFRAAAAENPALSPELLVRACADPSAVVRLGALRNPRLPEDLARTALAEAVELEERDPESDDAADVFLALADNSSLPAPLLVALAERELSAAAYTLLLDHPAEAWDHRFDAEQLLDTVCCGYHVDLLESLPITRFPWRIRLLMLERELCAPADLLELHDEDPWDEGAWDDLAWQLLDVHGPTEFWTYGNSDGDLPALIAADSRCTEALAERLVYEHGEHAPTMYWLARNDRLPMTLRRLAMHGWTARDNQLGDLAMEVRAWSLGHELLGHDGSWRERVRLAVRIDTTHDDVLTALGESSAETLVARAAGD